MGLVDVGYGVGWVCRCGHDRAQPQDLVTESIEGVGLPERMHDRVDPSLLRCGAGLRVCDLRGRRLVLRGEAVLGSAEVRDEQSEPRVFVGARGRGRFEYGKASRLRGPERRRAHYGRSPLGASPLIGHVARYFAEPLVRRARAGAGARALRGGEGNTSSAVVARAARCTQASRTAGSSQRSSCRVWAVES